MTAAEQVRKYITTVENSKTPDPFDALDNATSNDVKDMEKDLEKQQQMAMKKMKKKPNKKAKAAHQELKKYMSR